MKIDTRIDPRFDDLVKFLYEVDIMRLAGLGCPKDEYKPEAGLILKLKEVNEKEIYKIFRALFAGNVPVNIDGYAKIADFVNNKLDPLDRHKDDQEYWDEDTQSFRLG